ncbi:SpoIIE family protein phosphatase [Actinoplanes aureus]|uniref:SpoIIE family protein phosphatase n=1 Tax=Actinoplanes aureus TaxID=2792083 RepID=A0A931C7F9_9ACTN|nr:SpoIIE family protein phosphatase [Actinoplanes aureus]MBG0564849.1 SpoIIE family protein phosphatase [Actinoplanes aureus]
MTRAGPRDRPTWLVVVLVAIAYTVGAQLAFVVFDATSIVVLFLPSGVTLSALLLCPARQWPWILLTVAVAEVTVDVSHGLHLASALGFALANTAEPLVGAVLLRRFVPGRLDLTQRRHLLAFLGCCVVAGPLVGALVGGTTIAIGQDRAWVEAFLPFWAGDATGALTVAGTVLAWRHRPPPGAAPAARWALAVLLTVAVTAVSFWPQHLPLFYLPIPLLFWFGFQQRLAITMTAGLAMTVTANIMTSVGYGPWAALQGPIAFKTATLQLFLAVAVVGACLLTVGVAERDSARSDTYAERAARQRVAAVQSLTAQLARAPTSAAIAAAVAEGRLLGELCVVALADPEDGLVHTAEHRALARAARTGRPALDGDPANGRIELGVPVTDHDGPVLGALGFEFAAGSVVDDDTIAFAQTLADLTAQALRRARLYEREVSAARQLQQALLPAYATGLPSVQVDAGYRPADLTHDVGGDWYDVFHLPGDRIGFAVGDVVGHDLAAAAAMARLQAILRVLAQSAPGPAEVLAGLDEASALIHGARMCTVGYADYQPRTRQLRYACAGHPPPLLVTAGHGEYLWDGRSMPVAVEPNSRRDAELVVPADSHLIWYTDGLVERRYESMYAGLDRLAATAGAVVREGAGDPCRTLLDRMAHTGPATDDRVVLWISFNPDR